MWRLIVVTFAFLAFALYELSGGSNFQPQVATAKVQHLTPLKTVEAEAIVPDIPMMGMRKPEPKKQVDITLASMDIPADTPALMKEVTAVDATVMPAVAVDTALTDTEVSPRDIRKVTGRRVNMRQGPGTQFSVVSSLGAGDEVEVLQTPGNGWLKLQVVSTGRIGWMADWLVSEAAQ
ncbi:SH3 domain-containing protein [Donghicola sp. XS_ASV15]|uniref:SH3 domain-containing protein n=1 Tax=Donghicola sp. XS_ASV15 TaxID=3241295 RepID=UPI00351967A0